MLKRTAAIVATFIFAFLILSVSILKSARVYYAFSGEAKAEDISMVLGEGVKSEIDYYLPYPGKILPDNSLWFFKAGRDKLWLTLTTSHSRRAELYLLFADKRLGAAKTLFEKQKPEIAFSTLSKSGKYLEAAAKALEVNSKEGMDTTVFAESLSKASLKHKEVIEEIKRIASEDARPKINEVENYAENAYKISRDILRSKGADALESPFDWD